MWKFVGEMVNQLDIRHRIRRSRLSSRYPQTISKPSEKPSDYLSTGLAPTSDLTSDQNCIQAMKKSSFPHGVALLIRLTCWMNSNNETSMIRQNNNLSLAEHEGCTGEYWP